MAADSIRREIGLNQQVEAYQATGRLVVALVLVQLARGDLVAAEKAFKEWGNAFKIRMYCVLGNRMNVTGTCCESPEVQTLEMLLQAFDEEDPETAKKALNNPFIKHMDVEYAILARNMPLPEGITVPAQVKVLENVAASYVSPNAKHANQVVRRSEMKYVACKIIVFFREKHSQTTSMKEVYVN